jgi:hypothetical protein
MRAFESSGSVDSRWLKACGNKSEKEPVSGPYDAESRAARRLLFRSDATRKDTVGSGEPVVAVKKLAV